ncbi:MAG TPA: hypothetical protein DEW46_11260, partial [Verrucomicrobia bacterium]|nr:hypothetical protein [Verrucomicrobiota bacterium]
MRSGFGQQSMIPDTVQILVAESGAKLGKEKGGGWPAFAGCAAASKMRLVVQRKSRPIHFDRKW